MMFFFLEGIVVHNIDWQRSNKNGNISFGTGNQVKERVANCWAGPNSGPTPESKKNREQAVQNR
jgi:hypothetical protein